jgi:hypothetical protein
VPARPTHQQVEERFRKVIEASALPEPDEVRYEPDSVLFLWHEPKLAVFVDFDDPAVAAGESSAFTSRHSN